MLGKNKMVDNKEFKQTEIGKIPKEWVYSTLGELIEVHDSKRIPLSEMERAKRKGKYPYCGANGIMDYIDDYIFDGEFLLIAEDGGAYGKFENSCYLMNGKFWVNNHAHIIKAKDNQTINKFLFYMLNFQDLRPYIVGSTRRKLNQEYLRQIYLPLPPLPEQKKIAEILSTVDEAIEKVNKAIEGTERLKKGLMNELLSGRLRVVESIGSKGSIESRGSGESKGSIESKVSIESRESLGSGGREGRLSLRVRESKEFKDTEIGKIPKEWKVVRLEEVVSSYHHGIWGEDPTLREKSYAVIRSTEITHDGRINYLTASLRKIPSEKIKNYILQDGDILLVASSGSAHLIGRAALFKQPNDGRFYLFSNFMLRIRPKNMNAKFLFYFLNSHYYYWFLKVLQQTSTGLRNLPKKEFIKLTIPLPPLPEQKRIAEILGTVDKRLEVLKNKKQKFENIKTEIFK